MKPLRPTPLIPRRSCFPLLSLMLSGGFSVQAAITNDWIGAFGDSYTNIAGWSAGVLPTAVDTANIGHSSVSSEALVYTNAAPDPAATNALNSLILGGTVGSSGTFTMNSGTLSITNNGTLTFIPGFANVSSGSFIMNGGVLNVVRNASTFFQDSFQPGLGTLSSGDFTLNGGQALIMAGIELGTGGTSTLTVNGGTLIDNGWFGVGRGNGPNSTGQGTFNLTGGTVYLLRNPGNDAAGAANGIAFNQQGVNATVNVSGGTLFCHGFRFQVGPGANRSDTETFIFSGGDIYVGGVGFANNAGAGNHTMNLSLSGGTFHGVNMGPNTLGTLLTNSLGAGGTNWTWVASLPASLDGSPGPGLVTFAPEATRTITLNAPFSGSGSLKATGPGTVLLGAAESYAGGTPVTGGTLAISAAQTNSLGIVLSSGTTLMLNNNASLVDNPINLPGTATLNFSASNVQGFTNNVTGSGNLTVTVGANGAEATTGNLNHSGTTLITSGTLIVDGFLTNSSSVIVTNTGTLAGNGLIGSSITVASTNSPTAAHLRIGASPLNVPDTLTVSNLTLGAGSELDIKLVTATTTGGGVNDLLAIKGNLTINPNAFLNILPLQPLTAGTYVVATYTGTLTGTFTNTVGSLSRYGMSVDYSTAGQIKLNVSGSNASLKWVGYTNAPTLAATNWDVLTSSNWLNGVVKDAFLEGDAVTFDAGATNFNVVLSTTLYPASITFNDNSNYNVTGVGSGRISGGTGLTKNGTGTLLMAAGLGFGNDYTGPVQINGGILKMNGALSLGATNGNTTVASGATLDINGNAAGSEPIVLAGTGFGGTNGAINNSSATAPSQSGGPRLITLAGDTTINASGARWDVGNATLGASGGSFTGNGFNLTKIGANDIWLHEVGDIGVGDIFVNQGLLGFQYTVGMGNAAKTVTVAAGGSLGIFHAANTLSKNVVLTNGATINSTGDAGTSNVLNGTVTLYGPATNTITTSVPLEFVSAIGGTGGFQKSGSGTLSLEAVNGYSGPTIINAGSVVLRAGASIANSSLFNLTSSNTTLDTSLAGGLSLGSGRTLAGFGTILGNVTASSGSSVNTGSGGTPGTLTFNDSLTLNNATVNMKLGSDPFTVGGAVNDLLSVSGNLTLSGTVVIPITPVAPLNSSGPYTIMRYSGTLTGGAANLSVVSGNPRFSLTVVDPTTTPGSIQVNVIGNSGTLIWRGGKVPNPSAWDHTTTNWFNNTTLGFDQSYNGDLAIFDNSAATNIVNIVGTNSSGGIIFSNTSVAFTFVGGGALLGPLDMEGTSSLTLAMSNAPAFSGITNNTGTLVFQLQSGSTNAVTNRITAPISDNSLGQGTIIQGGTNLLVLSADNSLYTGAIAITNGILQYTNAIGLGSAAAPLYVSNNGTLDLNGLAPGLKNIHMAGNGYKGQGAIISSSGNLVNAGTANLTLDADASIAALNRWDVVGSTFNANGHSLTVLGPGATLIELTGDNTLADIHVVAGRLGFQGANVTMGDPTKTCTIESNATLTIFNANTANGGETKILVLKGSAVVDSGSASNTLNGPVFMTGTNLIGVRSTLAIANSISDSNGPGGFILGNDAVGASTGNLYLNGANTYSGPTIITNQTLYVGAASSLGNSSLVQVRSPGNLDVTSQATFTFGSGQRLAGDGTVLGNSIVLGSGATLAPGLGGNSTAALVINGGLTLQAGSTNVVVVNKTAGVANSKVTGLSSVSMTGTLVVNNVGNALAAGDAIPLFSASLTYNGGFGTIIPATPGNGLAWDASTLGTDGTLRVAAGTDPNPTNIVFAVSGNQLKFSWPSDHIGWTLQVQTNNLLGTNWVDVAGSTATNQIFIPIDPATKDAFYRMLLRQ